MKPRVAVFSTRFLPYSQTFVHDELGAHQRYEAHVFCARRLYPERFPHATVFEAGRLYNVHALVAGVRPPLRDGELRAHPRPLRHRRRLRGAVRAPPPLAAGGDLPRLRRAAAGQRRTPAADVLATACWDRRCCGSWRWGCARRSSSTRCCARWASRPSGCACTAWGSASIASRPDRATTPPSRWSSWSGASCTRRGWCTASARSPRRGARAAGAACVIVGDGPLSRSSPPPCRGRRHRPRHVRGRAAARGGRRAARHRRRAHGPQRHHRNGDRDRGPWSSRKRARRGRCRWSRGTAACTRSSTTGARATWSPSATSPRWRAGWGSCWPIRRCGGGSRPPGGPRCSPNTTTAPASPRWKTPTTGCWLR